MKAKRTLIALNVLLAAVLACNLPRPGSPAVQPGEPTGTPEAEVVLEASDTPTLAITETPSPTPTVTLTPTPAVPQASVTSATNCRTGPGMDYDLLWTMQPGQSAEIVGKFTDTGYWIIKKPNGGLCWLWGQYAVVTGNFAALPEYPQPPTPTPSIPAAPTGLKAPFTCTLQPSLLRYKVHVNLSWNDNATNEKGYYIYLNGDLLATVGANKSAFSDDTIMGTAITIPKPKLTYAVQAFNAAGKSDKIFKTISCFD